MSERFEVRTLGCGSAKPSTRHNPSSTLVNFRDNLFMIDCGEGAQQQLQIQHQKFSRLRHIFLTHMHGDHVLGLPGLIGTLALSGLEGVVTIYTFADGAKILRQIFEYFNHDCPINYQFRIIRPEENVVFENDSLRVRTVPLRHRVPTVGYVFEEKEKLRRLNREMCDFHGISTAYFNRIKGGEDFVKPDGVTIPNRELTLDPPRTRSYAHIGDTAYMPGLASKIRGVDLLMHETTYTEEKAAVAGARGHSTARQAAMTARDAGVGRLLTGHYSSTVADERQILREAREIFPNTILNREGLVVQVGE